MQYFSFIFMSSTLASDLLMSSMVYDLFIPSLIIHKLYQACMPFVFHQATCSVPPHIPITLNLPTDSVRLLLSQKSLEITSQRKTKFNYFYTKVRYIFIQTVIKNEERFLHFRFCQGSFLRLTKTNSENCPSRSSVPLLSWADLEKINQSVEW